MTFSVVNPTTGQTQAVYPGTPPEELEDILDGAHEAQQRWRQLSLKERADRLRRCAALLRERKEELALLMAGEMGKVVTEGRSEIDKCSWVCEYYADSTSGLEPQHIETDFQRSYVTFQPLGVVLAIMPWNFPFWQVFRCAAPALLAGNGVLLKHASNVSGCSLAIETLFRDAELPPGLFRSLFLDSSRTEALIGDRRIQAATLTGSTGAGRAVAAAAGKALKKTVLELGGSDPYVILEDADLELAAEKCLTSRMINCGQSCIAAKRWIVVEAIRDDFEALMRDKVHGVTMGDPFDESTDIGPMATCELRDDLHRQVEESVAAGARLLVGGRVPERAGAFYPPTLLADVSPGMAAFDDELFGPVASIVAATDEADAIRLANLSQFGLGAAVFTQDVERGEHIASQWLEAGCCFVNDFVRSDPRLPFGGIKNSGYGRELAEFGLREFVNVKTVAVA